MDRIFTFLIALLFVAASSARASDVIIDGRFSVGAYGAKEDLQVPDESPATVHNDFATLSERAYLRASNLGENRYEFVADLRDTNDFFDRLDQENLRLTGSNAFQARQLSVRYPGEKYFAAVGRFPVPEAGAVFADGAEAGTNLGDGWALAGFGGYNPKQEYQTYVQTNLNAEIYGLFSTYQPGSLMGPRSVFMSNALVVERLDHATDRFYWFETANWVSPAYGRLYTLSYLDFLPKTNLQTGILQYERALTPEFTLQGNLLSVDTIEYARRQDIRETLAASLYREVGLQASYYPAQSSVSYTAETSIGERMADHLKRNDNIVGARFLRFFGPDWDFYANAEYRADFVSDDLYGKVGLAYYVDEWESTFDVQSGGEHYTDGTFRHPIISNFALSRNFWREYFITMELEYSHDEVTNVMAGSVLLTYRFGNAHIAPPRDRLPVSKKL